MGAGNAAVGAEENVVDNRGKREAIEDLIGAFPELGKRRGGGLRCERRLRGSVRAAGRGRRGAAMRTMMMMMMMMRRFGMFAISTIRSARERKTGKQVH